MISHRQAGRRLYVEARIRDDYTKKEHEEKMKKLNERSVKRVT